MAILKSKTLFVTTSPRSPLKMVPEVKLLAKYFTGQKWTVSTQREFMDLLGAKDFFRGNGINDPAFSARDRINRAPKNLGFVQLKPTIKLTPAGKKLIAGCNTEEVFLRQLLKFQLPSPFHKQDEANATFCIKPYLEILRLIYTLGSLKFDELQLFAMQFTDYKNFEAICTEIKKFRKASANQEYSRYFNDYFRCQLINLYQDEISDGRLKTRENPNANLEAFLRVKRSNMRDYADACVRYLRVTGLVNVSNTGRSLSIVNERIDDVKYILKTVPRQPTVCKNEQEYIAYLGDANSPKLLTDDKKRLINKLNAVFPTQKVDANKSLDELKSLYADLTGRRKKQILQEQISHIKTFQTYDDIQKTFDTITSKNVYDAPLMFEWNTWRAMTMLDGGTITANLTYDDFGQPLCTAHGNLADIECDYGDFGVSVEVTLSSGQRQYEAEGEPVARHLGKLKKERQKPFYCLFIAPKISDACIAHFFILQKTNVSYYGGNCNIIPLDISTFQKMIQNIYHAGKPSGSTQIKEIFDYASQCASNSADEQRWYVQIKQKALEWGVANK